MIMWGVLNDHNFTLNVFPKDGGTHCTKMASPPAESGSLFTNVDNAIASNFFLSTDSTCYGDGELGGRSPAVLL